MPYEEGDIFAIRRGGRRAQLAELGLIGKVSLNTTWNKRAVVSQSINQSINQSVNPILIQVYTRKRGWPDLPHFVRNLSNSHSPSRSIHGVLFLQTNALALLLHLRTISGICTKCIIKLICLMYVGFLQGP